MLKFQLLLFLIVVQLYAKNINIEYRKFVNQITKLSEELAYKGLHRPLLIKEMKRIFGKVKPRMKEQWSEDFRAYYVGHAAYPVMLTGFELEARKKKTRHHVIFIRSGNKKSLLPQMPLSFLSKQFGDWSFVDDKDNTNFIYITRPKHAPKGYKVFITASCKCEQMLKKCFVHALELRLSNTFPEGRYKPRNKS